MQDLKVIRAQALQAEFDLTPGLVGRARGNLGGQRDFLAPGGHHPPDALLALPVAVSMCRVDIGNAEVNRAVERLDGFVLVLIHEKPAAGAKAQDRHPEAGAAQRAGG